MRVLFAHVDKVSNMSKTHSKYINPLDLVEDKTASASVSGTDSRMESLSGLQVTSENVCPKCGDKTVPSYLTDGEEVRFCPRCSVTMAVRL